MKYQGTVTVGIELVCCKLKMDEARIPEGEPFLDQKLNGIRAITGGYSWAARIVSNGSCVIGQAKKEAKDVERTRGGFDGPEILLRPTVQPQTNLTDLKITPHATALRLEKSEFHRLAIP